MADNSVIANIRKAAAATGADPAALLATSLVESGARPGIVGDQGTSFGPFQFHRGGALGTHSPAWADSYAAVLNRAQEFRRLQVHGGKGAAAVQRPADPTGYATKVQANLARARSMLGEPAAAAAPKGLATTPAAIPNQSDPHGPDPAGDDVLAAMQRFQGTLDANAKLAGISAPTLLAPTLPSEPQAPTPRTTVPTKTGKSKPALQPTGRVIPGKPRIIGTPYHGTHTVGNWESDNAVDVAMPTGTPIRAPADGIIGSQIGSLGSNNPRFAGLRVHLKMAGNELYLAHLSRLAVKAGERVRAGQIIGYSGSANGVEHLHLGAKSGNPGRYA